MVVTLITISFSVVSVCGGGFCFTTLVEVLAPLVSLGTVCLRPGPLQLCHLSLISILRGQSHMLGGTKVALDLSSRVGFRAGRFLDMRRSLRLSSSSQVRDVDKGCCGVFQRVEFGTDFFLNAFGRDRSM